MFYRSLRILVFGVDSAENFRFTLFFFSYEANTECEQHQRDFVLSPPIRLAEIRDEIFAWWRA